ncbi:hypothetical protein EHF44_08005 [Cupriavidus pauculus]|uniref:Uncharacterized protein n=1 Tax=Cupriavidus pauculus TaxID=82633 RepID=A0A3G8H4F0_9BURK|nr:hypothetical protein EHF44_08005 [Cupriavidus pauculus]
MTGWASYPRRIAVCSARGQARAAGKLTDISSYQAARRHDGRRGPIEYSRARHAPETRLDAGVAARARILRCREDTVPRHAGRGRCPVTEFISVRLTKCRAPMNRSLGWGQAGTRLGPVGSSI